MEGTETSLDANESSSSPLIGHHDETMLHNLPLSKTELNGTETSHNVAASVNLFESSSPAPLVGNPSETPPNSMSKRQLKKLKKLQEYQSLRKERRAVERQRIKDRRAAAIAQGLPISSGPSRKELKKRQKKTGDNLNALSVAIDLDYDDLMSDSDISKCIKQCLRMYTINRRSEKPCRMHFTGIKTDGRIHAVLKKNDGWQNWNVQYHFDRTHEVVFDKTKQVYLTCESENVLDKLEAECTYVIGGLVDHNHQKGLSHDRALKANLKTARLPLSEHVDMKTRSVLSTFHVFQMLLCVSEGKSWTEAILETVPARKGAKPKPATPNQTAQTPVLNTKNDSSLPLIVPETEQPQQATEATMSNTSC